MSAKEQADKLDAYDRLIARGYRRHTCETCGGIGQLTFDGRLVQCIRCNGSGSIWTAPVLRLEGAGEIDIVNWAAGLLGQQTK